MIYRSILHTKYLPIASKPPLLSCSCSSSNLLGQLFFLLNLNFFVIFYFENLCCFLKIFSVNSGLRHDPSDFSPLTYFGSIIYVSKSSVEFLHIVGNVGSINNFKYSRRPRSVRGSPVYLNGKVKFEIRTRLDQSLSLFLLFFY